MNGRAFFESEADRNAERDFAAWTLREYGLQLNKLPVHYEIDFWAEKDGDLFCLVEYKKRSRIYSDLMLSVHKCVAGYRWANYYGVPFIIVVECDGVRYWTEYARGRNRVRFAGRSTNTRDAQDVEPCEFIDWHRFTTMRGRGDEFGNKMIVQKMRAA